MGLQNLPTVDPFSNLDSMRDNYISDGQNINVLCGMSEDKIAAGYSRIEKDNDIDSDVEWKKIMISIPTLNRKR